MEPSHGRTRLGPGKDPDLDQELDNKDTQKSKLIDGFGAVLNSLKLPNISKSEFSNKQIVTNSHQ